MVRFTFISSPNKRRKSGNHSPSLVALLLLVVSISSISASTLTLTKSNQDQQRRGNLSLRTQNESSQSSKIISEALSRSKVLTRRRQDAQEEEEDESTYQSSKDGKGKSKQDEYEEEEDGYGYDDAPYASPSRKPSSSSSKGSSYKSSPSGESSYSGDDNDNEEEEEQDDAESKSQSKGSSGSNSKTWHRATRSSTGSASSKTSKSNSSSKWSITSSPTSEPTAIGTATVPVLKTWSSETSTWVVTDGWSTSTEYSSPTPTVAPDAGDAAVGLPQAQATQAWVTKKAKVVALAIASASSKAVAAAAISTAAPVAGGLSSPQQLNVDYSWMTPSPGQVYSGGQDVVLAWQAAQAPDLDSLHLQLCLLKSADDIRIGAYKSGVSCGEAATTEVEEAGNNAWQITFPAPNVTAADSFYVVLQVGGSASSSSSSSDDSEESDSSDYDDSSSDDSDSEKKYKDSKSKWSSLEREKRGSQTRFSIRDDSASASQMLSPAFVLAPFGSDTSAATIQAAAQLPSDSSDSSSNSDSSDKRRPSNALAIALPLSIAGTVALAALGLMCYRRGQRGNFSEQENHRRMLEASRIEDRKERQELSRQLTMAMAVTSSHGGSSIRSSRLGSSVDSTASSISFGRRGSDKDLPKPPPQAVAHRDEEEKRFTSFTPARRAQPLDRSRTRSHHSSRLDSRLAQSPRSSTYYSSRDMLRRNESKSSSSYYHSRCDCSSCDSDSSISSGSSSPTGYESYERSRRGYGHRYFLDDPTPPPSRRSHHRHHRSDPFGHDHFEKDKEAMRYTDARLAAMQVPHLSMNMHSLPPAPMMERVYSSSPPHYATAFMRANYPIHQAPQPVSIPASLPLQQPDPVQVQVQVPAPAVVQEQQQQQQQQIPPPPPMMIFTSPTESQNSSAYYDAASAVNVAAPIPRVASSQVQSSAADGFGGFSSSVNSSATASQATQRIVSSPPLSAQASTPFKSSIPDILRPSSPVGAAGSSKSSGLPSLPNPFELLGLRSKVEVASSPASNYSQDSTPTASPQQNQNATNLGVLSAVPKIQPRSVSSSFAEASLNTGVRGSVAGQASASSIQKAGEAQAIYEKLRDVLKGTELPR